MIEAMDDAIVEGYKPTEEYEEELRDPLVDLSLIDSTELWLIQWPYKQMPDFDGKELSLELRGNGRLGSFEDSSGKAYDIVSNDFQEPDEMVFLNYPSEPKIDGKISRQVSLVHYPEPKEVEELIPDKIRQLHVTSSGASMPNHRFASSGQSSWRRNSQLTLEHSSYTQSSRYKSFSPEGGEPSKHSKRRRAHEPNHSTDHSLGRNSEVTSLGSSERSHQEKLKRKGKS